MSEQVLVREGAHERALREAQEWWPVAQANGFGDYYRWETIEMYDPEAGYYFDGRWVLDLPPRLPSGETDVRDVVEADRMGGVRVLPAPPEGDERRVKRFSANPDSDAFRAELAAAMDVVFDVLKTSDADLLRERFFERCTTQEMAETRGITRQALDGRLATAKQNLKVALAGCWGE